MTPPLRRLTAFSLVEVTLALGVMSFCLVAIFGLLPVGFNSNQAAIEQTNAASIAAALVADLRQTPLPITGATTDPQSPRFLLSVPVTIAGSQAVIHTLFLTESGAAATSTPTTSAQDLTADPSQNPRYRATMVFTRPEQAMGGTYRNATVLRLLITWPALADSTGGTLPKQSSGSFETVVALDRN